MSLRANFVETMPAAEPFKFQSPGGSIMDGTASVANVLVQGLQYSQNWN